MDDRHVPELLNFAYDLDTEYLNAVLLSPAPFNARRQLAAVADKHGLDTEAFTLDEDQTGWRWRYTIPAGQTLGYAARPSTRSERRHPDVWRWDDPPRQTRSRGTTQRVGAPTMISHDPRTGNRGSSSRKPQPAKSHALIRQVEVDGYRAHA